MKPGRVISSTVLSIVTLATLSYPQAEVVSLTAKELYAHLKKPLGQGKEAEWTEYQGKTVHWTGNPRPSGTRDVTDQGFLIDLISEGELGCIWLRVYFPVEHAKELSGLSRYDSVGFKGKLADYSPWVSGSGYHFLIMDAHLTEITRAENLVSVVDHKFDVQPSPSSGNYRFMEFDVILRNEGEHALRGVTLEVNLGPVKGTKRNVVVGPQTDAEVWIWFIDKWIVNGKEEMPPFDIPSGSWTGTIQLKDETGRVITSEPFSHSLPAIEETVPSE